MESSPPPEVALPFYFLYCGQHSLKWNIPGRGRVLAADEWHDLKITIMQTKDSFDIVPAITEIKVHLCC